MQKPREIAVRLLMRHADGAGWLEDLLDAEFQKGTIAPADRGLVQELAYGVIRWQATLDWLISRKTDERPQKALLQTLLRLGLYQLFFLDRIPDHAAVHESVQLARDLGFGTQSGFVNAVLRNCLRDRDTLTQDLQALKTSSPDIGYSHPRWLCERWERRWGPDKLRAQLDWNNTPPPVYLRVNTLKTTPGRLAEQLQKEDVLFTPRSFDWAPANGIFELRSHPPLTTLKSFQEGHFYLQDPSTLLAVHALDPKPDQTVLDLCAAPGGKATFIAQLMENRGSAIAYDSEPRRLRLITENSTRLGASMVKVTPADPLDAADAPAAFDRILIDAPCSNTGVMRRRVELRWRIQPSEIERLRAVQLTLLQRAAPRLKPGGTLVYSTCSLEPEENADVVQAFLNAARDYQLVRERELIPFVDGTDGAFVAVLKRG